jgi:uncharacterized membrane protein YcfT
MSSGSFVESVRRAGSAVPVARRETGNRIAWVDYAKGLCIFAVVAMYATHHVQQLLHETGWMQRVVDFAQPFRMPDFFLLSGLFVARVIDRPLRKYIDTKILFFLYFYCIWVTFRFAYTDLRVATDRLSLWSDYLWLYIEPPSGPLWFIYLLAIFFLAVRLLRGLSPPLVLIGATMLNLAQLNTGFILVDKFAHYFVFFYAGHLFSAYIFRFAEWAQAHARVVMALIAVWLVGNGFLVFDGWSADAAVSLFLGFTGAFAVLLFATLCRMQDWLGWLAYLGRNSIVIYLGFVVPLALMRRFIVGLAGHVDVGTVTLLVTLICVAGALVLYLVLRRMPLLRFVYARPAWISFYARQPGRWYG